MDSNSLRQIFSANLKKFRKIKGLTQNELARLTELSPQTIIRIEGAKLWPSDKTLCKLAEVLNVDLTGEIFLVNDEFSNQNIERELGRMGVETRRSLTVGSFLKDAIIPKAFQSKETHLQRAEKMAKPYLNRDIGGDALECVSDVVFAKKKGKDGIIHISPFTCMPEIMSQNIFPTIKEDHNIPLLTLIMDEQTGRAGYITRLEAFVDLMRRKKRAETMKGKEAEKVK